MPETDVAADARGRGAAGPRRGGRPTTTRHLHGHLQLSGRGAAAVASPRCESPTSAPRGPSATTRCARAAGGRRARGAAGADDPRRDRRGRRAATPIAPWSRSRTRSRARCARPSTRSPSTRPTVTIVGEHDQPITQQPDRPRASSRSTRSRWSSRTRSRAPSARASSADRAARGRRSARRRAPPTRSARSPSPSGPGRRSGRPRRREIYGCVVLREGVEDEPGNVTRFVWIAPAGDRAATATARGRRRSASPSSAPTIPGALVEALTEFSSRDVNLTRIESRPLRAAGSAATCSSRPRGPRSTTARSPRRSTALRGKAENVRVLGSYPVEGSDGTSPALCSPSRWRPDRPLYNSGARMEASPTPRSVRRPAARLRAHGRHGSWSSTRATSRSTSARCAARRCWC